MAANHRVFILTDIENEPDDTESLVRLLLYSNDIDIEGLVAVTSTWLRNSVHPESIRKVLKGYAEVRDKLLRVDKRYPEVSYLESLVGEHVVKYGMEGVGEKWDSSGSNMLIAAVDKDDERPIHVCLWGGANCLAQALWRVKKDRSEEQVKKFASKIRVYGISDQDDGGPWIRRHFPLIQYVVSVHGENAYMTATWLGFPLGSFRQFPKPDLPYMDTHTVSDEWLKKNIQVGPLGSHYPDIGFGMEGDTPSYLGCIPNGLNDPDHPDYGGWAGRYKLIFDLEARHFHDTTDHYVSEIDGSTQHSGAASIWRWRTAVQHDFASRMRWTMEEDESKLQKPPVVVVDGDDSIKFITKQCSVGDTLEFDASGSYSPNGAKLTYKWFQYKEIDSYIGPAHDCPDFEMHGTEKSPKLRVTAPPKTQWVYNDRTEYIGGRVYHIILQVTDDGDFPLTRYRRILLDVRE